MSSRTPTRLVSAWTLASGNVIEVRLDGGLDGAGLVTATWDAWPPSAADIAEYQAVIRPAFVRRVELPACALLIGSVNAEAPE